MEKKHRNQEIIDQKKANIENFKEDLMILENLYAQILLDKRALERCENQGDVVNPEISHGGSFKRLKRRIRKAAADPLEASADTTAFKTHDPRLIPDAVDITQSQNLDSKTQKFDLDKNPDIFQKQSTTPVK